MEAHVAGTIAAGVSAVRSTSNAHRSRSGARDVGLDVASDVRRRA